MTVRVHGSLEGTLASRGFAVRKAQTDVPLRHGTTCVPLLATTRRSRPALVRSGWMQTSTGPASLGAVSLGYRPRWIWRAIVLVGFVGFVDLVDLVDLVDKGEHTQVHLGW